MKPFDPRLIRYARETRKFVVILGLLGLVTALLVAAQTFLIAGILAPIFYADPNKQRFTQLLVLLVVVFLVRAAVQYFQDAIAHRSALKVIASLRKQVLDHAVLLSERWLNAGNTTRVVTLITRGLDDLESYFVSFLPQLFLCATATPILLVIVLYLDWISALAIVLCIPLIPIFMILIGKMTASYSSARLEAMQKLGTQLLDLLAGLTTLKAVGRERGPEKRVRALGNAFTKKTMQTLYVAFLSGAALEFITTISTAIVAVEVGFRMVAGNLLLFEGLAIIMLTPEVFKPLREVGTQFHASANGVAAAQQTFAILETPLPAQATAVSASGAASSTSASTRTAEGSTAVTQASLHEAPITIDAVSVYAPGRATVAPANLSAVINPGEITVLRGPSGSGKSTTVQLLLGLLAPSEGQVKVGASPLGDVDREAWWSGIAWVPQRPVLIPGTVLENLSVLDPGDEALRHAAALTGFDEVVTHLPHGWNTRIGQGGVGLSVGQRQRLALTRALLSKEKIVVLDEPTAHLDAVSEEQVTRSVQELKAAGHTVIVIAHRAALTRAADKIIDVAAGTRDISAELAQVAAAQARAKFLLRRQHPELSAPSEGSTHA